MRECSECAGRHQFPVTGDRPRTPAEREYLASQLAYRRCLLARKGFQQTFPLPTVHHMDINTSDRFVAAEFAGPLVVPGVTSCLGNY